MLTRGPSFPLPSIINLLFDFLGDGGSAMTAADMRLGELRHPRWIYLLLGIVFVVTGLVVLGDVVAATVISTVLIGLCAIVAGLFEIIHSFWTKGWGGFLWQLIMGGLYLLGGISLVTSPLAGSLILTYVLGFVLVASGVVRVILGLRNIARAGGLLLLSGGFGVVAGVLILLQWPYSGLWIIGLFLGLDLIIHGAGWLALALTPASPGAAVGRG
jgi:uncharacterized membrane protein HdeD (DUF308 family)